MYVVWNVVGGSFLSFPPEREQLHGVEVAAAGFPLLRARLIASVWNP